MREKRVSRGERALSPVVGTLLLVAVVVALAATAGLLVANLDTTRSDPPTALLECTYDAGDDRLVIHHGGGETLTGGTLAVRNGSATLLTASPTGFGAGDTVAGTVSTAALRDSERLRVVWRAGRGDTSTVLASPSPARLSPASAHPRRNETVYALDSSPGATTTHVVSYTLAAGESEVGDPLDGVRVAYDRTDVSAVSNASGDVEALGVDTDGDGDVEKDYRAELSSLDTTDGGHTLVVDVSGVTYRLQAGDRVVLRYADVRNPSAGTYTVRITPDYHAGDPETGTLEIGG